MSLLIEISLIGHLLKSTSKTQRLKVAQRKIWKESKIGDVPAQFLPQQLVGASQ
jgi:hypothetical protein